jgi:hypothetical protein
LLSESSYFLLSYFLFFTPKTTKGSAFESCGGKYFHFSMSSRPALGPTQPLSQCVRGALSAGVKRPGREAHQSSPTSAEVKKTWIYTSTPPYAFMAQCLIS